jgi:hypothetical protein
MAIADSGGMAMLPPWEEVYDDGKSRPLGHHFILMRPRVTTVRAKSHTNRIERPSVRIDLDRFFGDVAVVTLLATLFLVAKSRKRT